MRTSAPGVINQEYSVISHHTIGSVWFNHNTNEHSFHSLQHFNPGDKIADFNAGSVSDTPTYLTVQTGLHRHITLSPTHLQYINHSCSPNVFFDTTSMELVCLQPIRPGDEMRFFYPSTEWQMAQPFVCNCGSEHCLQLINGASGLSDETLLRYRLTDFIRQQVKHRL